MEEDDFRVWVSSPALGSFVLVYLCGNVSYSTPDAAAVASKGDLCVGYVSWPFRRNKLLVECRLRASLPSCATLQYGHIKWSIIEPLKHRLLCFLYGIRKGTYCTRPFKRLMLGLEYKRNIGVLLATFYVRCCLLKYKAIKVVQLTDLRKVRVALSTEQYHVLRATGIHTVQSRVVQIMRKQ